MNRENCKHSEKKYRPYVDHPYKNCVFWQCMDCVEVFDMSDKESDAFRAGIEWAREKFADKFSKLFSFSDDED